jgi:hypothetical protein
MKHTIKLTAELENTILSWIRAGGYPHVAALAAGVPESVWRQWQERGKTRNPYKRFLAQVAQAHATARLKAETATLEDDARFWLKHGPGREAAGNPGWANMVGPTLTQTNETSNVFLSGEFLQFMATLRAALSPYPEALLALSKALEQPIEYESLPNSV